MVRSCKFRYEISGSIKRRNFSRNTKTQYYPFFQSICGVRYNITLDIKTLLLTRKRLGTKLFQINLFSFLVPNLANVRHS